MYILSSPFFVILQLLRLIKCWLHAIVRQLVLISVIKTDWKLAAEEADLGRDIGIVVVLQQQRGRLDIVFLGGDVQRRESNFAAKIVLQQHSHDLVMTLLQSDSQRREPVLQPT